MLARNPYLPSTFGNQVGDELTAGGVNTTHYSRVFVYLILQSTSDWQVNSDGLKLNGAAVGTTPYAIIDSGIRFSPGPTTDVESIARPFEFVDHHLFQPRVHRRLQCHVQCRIQRRRCRLRDHQEGPSDLLVRTELPLRIDDDRLSSNSWKVVDLGRRLHAQVLRETRCDGMHEAFTEGAEVNGQSSAELGGHVSSSTLSAHQMPARDDLYSTSYKDRERKSAGPHDVADAPPPDLHLLLNEVCHGAWDCWARRENHLGRVQLLHHWSPSWGSA